MTDELIDKLAEKMLDKLLERCSKPEWHVRRSDDFVKENEEERMIGEMSKLMTMMVFYQEKGEDDKAKLMEEKISILNDKINKIK